MRFRSFDHLRVFNVVASHHGFTPAAKELNLTKGAVSYQISRLEQELGFKVFTRTKRGVALTTKGSQLLQTSQAAFNNIESEIQKLREGDSSSITIGMSTYFASRWLSPRLMTFMAKHPAIGLRIQPLINLEKLININLAIRWGKGDWVDPDMVSELIFRCPAMLTMGKSMKQAVDNNGIETALKGQPLLHDRDDSDAWQNWFNAAKLDYTPTSNSLVIPDPNVRVQAVIDNQGVALNDELVAGEISSGQLFQYTEVELTEYGYYLVYPKAALNQTAIKAFRDWVMQENNAVINSAFLHEPPNLSNPI
jgi:DNA-binding transcriptional LysR family regulator